MKDLFGGNIPIEIKYKIEYRTWKSMISRCINKNDSNYHNYGKRGITVCPEWLNSFETFLKDIGQKSNKKLSIHRKDNNGPYAKWNCKWATAKEQAQNRRNNTKKLQLARSIRNKRGNLARRNRTKNNIKNISVAGPEYRINKMWGGS